MTPEQWKIVEQRLIHHYGRTTLLVDGYDLSLVVCAIKPLRYAIIPYVNGELCGKWFTRRAGESSEEARRFFPLKQRCLYPRAVIQKLGKQAAALARRDVIEYHGVYWTRFTALKRHLIANNKSIELVEEPQEQRA